MPCQFPFIHNGVTYNECTDALIEVPEYDYGNDDAGNEEFWWCATLVDSNRNMVENMWGICDASSCTKGTSKCYGDACEMIRGCILDNQGIHQELFKIHIHLQF